MADQGRGFFGGIRDRLGQMDRWVASEAARRAEGNKRAGVVRNLEFIRNQPADRVAREIAGQRNLSEDGAKAVQDMIQQAMSLPGGRARIGRAYGREMNRAPGGFGQYGVMEAINRGIADKEYVRRGVLPTAILGGGALMTAGAQQLIALMGFMEDQQVQEARVQQPGQGKSPDQGMA